MPFGKLAPKWQLLRKNGPMLGKTSTVPGRRKLEGRQWPKGGNGRLLDRADAQKESYALCVQDLQWWLKRLPSVYRCTHYTHYNRQTPPNIFRPPASTLSFFLSFILNVRISITRFVAMTAS